MPTLTIGFTKASPEVKRTVAGKEETVYDITISGAVNLSLSMTPKEFRWKRDQLQADAQRLQSLIVRDSSPLNQDAPKDTSAEQAELATITKYLLIAQVLASMAPGGVLT